MTDFHLTDDNVSSVHAFLEGALEVCNDCGDTSSQRAHALADALSSSTNVKLPATINVPGWLADELWAD